MTAVVESGRIWNTMPGWGIVADLTPPELSAKRQLVVIRKLLAVGLGLVLVLCVVGAVVATLKQNSASSALTKEQDRTSALQRQANSFTNVTTIQATVSRVDAQITAVMGSDVDFKPFLDSIVKALPATASIQTMGVLFSPAAVQAAGAASLDTSDKAVIGKVTLTGQATQYNSIAKFVDQLKAIPGVVEIVPNSQAQSGASASYNITFQVDSTLLSHRYDNLTTASGATR